MQPTGRTENQEFMNRFSFDQAGHFDEYSCNALHRARVHI